MNTTLKQIILNDNIVALIKTTNTEIMDLKNQIKVKDDYLSNILTGICVQEGVDLATEGISFGEDLKTLTVTLLPVKQEDPIQAPMSAKRGKK